MQFTGTLEQQAFKALLFSVLEQNESPNAYSIAPPAGGVSGWAFGVLQYDVLNNPAAYNLLANVLLQATDLAGNYIVDPTNIAARGTAANILDSDVLVLMSGAYSRDRNGLSGADQIL